jgi:3-hydroxyisobutyrate dehydrogenase-like beta-hydroxyacid dehydrogenase
VTPQQENMKRNIGFIGTGLMGRGMVRNLIRKGHSVRVYNRTRSKAEEAAQGGGVAVSSPAEAVSDAEFVVTMLADPAAVMRVLEGPNGILAAILPDTILIDSSTISPPTTLRVRELLQARGAHMIDAPVFGSKNEAEKGELGFIVGGEDKIVSQAQAVLDCMGKTIRVGRNGMGAYTKLVVNSIIATTLQAFNEGMMLAMKAGIDPDLMFQVLQSSRARSGIIDMKGPQILKRDFSPFFPLRLMAKDVGLVLETATELNVPMPLAAALQKVYESCISDGLADEDFAATVKFLEKQTGVKVKSTAPS